MRRTLLVIAAASLGAATLPAAAQIKMDMNKITCQDMLGYNAADRTFLQYWMSGYYNAAANSDILDFKRLETNTAKVLAYCKKNKSMMLSGAINKIAK
jgi:acid stress chaperone HdeB